MLKDRLRQALMERATLGGSTTYKALADRVGIVPPQTIHRICEALEILMEEDVTAGRPMLTALCVSKTGAKMPAQGFFRRLGYSGSFLASLVARMPRCFIGKNLGARYHFMARQPIKP